jgi:hypothetical protein
MWGTHIWVLGRTRVVHASSTEIAAGQDDGKPVGTPGPRACGFNGDVPLFAALDQGGKK